MIRENLDHCQFRSGFEFCVETFSDCSNESASKAANLTWYMSIPFVREDIFEPVMEAISQAEIVSADGIVVIRSPRKRKCHHFLRW